MRRFEWRIFTLGVVSGLLAAVILIFSLSSHLQQRVIDFFGADEERWASVVASKKASWENREWRDERGTILFIGDSQVEMGNWSELFQGRFPIRNMGLSSAKVRDVRELVASMPDRSVDVVVLWCGVNSMSLGVEQVARDYKELWEETSRVVKPKKWVVLSVMPVAFPDQMKTSQLNRAIGELNRFLKQWAEEKGGIYVDLWPAVSSEEKLKSDFTTDGLHLNSEGYRRIAEVLASSL